MHKTMTNVYLDIEHKLDRVYKGGAANKFGIENIGNTSSRSTS